MSSHGHSHNAAVQGHSHAADEEDDFKRYNPVNPPKDDTEYDFNHRLTLANQNN